MDLMEDTTDIIEGMDQSSLRYHEMKASAFHLTHAYGSMDGECPVTGQRWYSNADDSTAVGHVTLWNLPSKDDMMDEMEDICMKQDDFNTIVEKDYDDDDDDGYYDELGIGDSLVLDYNIELCSQDPVFCPSEISSYMSVTSHPLQKLKPMDNVSVNFTSRNTEEVPSSWHYISADSTKSSSWLQSSSSSPPTASSAGPRELLTPSLKRKRYQVELDFGVDVSRYRLKLEDSSIMRH
ncbi:hypothetical protein V1511DRAFT_497589 [Dipodascopsis uninucleata]